jgi:hypothetical protein
MKTTLFSRTALAVSAVLFTGIGAAYAADLGWYSGGNATLADPDSVTTLKFYDDSGNVITSGSTDGPIAPFAAADGTVRAGDTRGTLYAYSPSGTTAPGAWTGAQISNSTKFAGDGGETGPGAVSGKQFHKAVSSDTSLADYIAGYPNTSAGANLANIYEIRLRTSSGSGVGADYASGFVKVSGSTWTQVATPTLGESTAVGTTTKPGSKSLTYGTSTTIPVTVIQASGSTAPVGKVTFHKGDTKLGEAAVNSGIANVPVGKTSLLPGTYSLTFKFVPTDTNAFAASTATKSYSVAKRSVSASLSIKKAPTSTKSGSAEVKISASSGLPVPSGKVEFRWRKSGSSKYSKTTGTLSSTGKKTFTISKKSKGTWEFQAKYLGSSRYSTKTTSWKKVKVTS